MSRSILAVLLLATLAVMAWFCIVVIDEREQGFRTLLDDPDWAIPGGIYKNEPNLTEPGIYVRIPFLHEVYRYDRRLLHYDARPFELFTKDKLLVEVDYYAIWRIDDPRQFYESFRDTGRALKRFDDLTYSKVQETIPQYSLIDLISENREKITREITDAANVDLKPLGLSIVDLRIRRTDYPESNLEQIFSRMRTERNRFAMKYRAEGEEQALEIRSTADRESRVIRATAEGDSTRLRGDGDAEATRVYAEAYSQDPEFYSFMRSLEAYRTALDDETTMILSKEMPFLKHLFDNGTGRRR